MDATALWEHAVLQAQRMLDTPQGVIAIVSVAIAGGLVIAASFVKTMIPLRWLAVGSNVGFIAYAAFMPSLPMLLLHATLLPINLWRVLQMLRLTRQVQAAVASQDDSGVWLKPYMRSQRMAAGRVLFKKGDHADRLYLLASGRVELVEIGVALEPGRIFGEIAFFAPDRRRTMTARCLKPCLVLSIDEITVRELYHQNPDFGFALVALIAGRLSDDVRRLERRLTDPPVNLRDPTIS